ncbi:unnamed protein product, partial [Staurois parvus]
MVGVTGQVQQVASSVVQRVRQRGWSGASRDQSRKSAVVQIRQVRKGTETGCRTDTGPRTKHNTKAESASLA